MENVSTGELSKNKEHYLRCKDKTVKSYDVLKNVDLQSFMSNLLPNCCLKVDFQNVDQHIGGKWLIHHPNHCTIICKAWNSS